MLDASKNLERSLRDAFGCFATGVTVVTLRDSTGKATGLTVNSFSSLSLDPPLILFSVGRTQPSATVFESEDAFNVNVLSSAQEALAWHFARPRDEKCADVATHDAANGVPLIDEALAGFVCRKHALVDGGDHVIVIGEVIDFQARDATPLIFYKGKMQRLRDGS